MSPMFIINGLARKMTISIPPTTLITALKVLIERNLATRRCFGISSFKTPASPPCDWLLICTESDHYITVRSNSGLNQMRTGIADIVAVAHIMNATLVIPELDKRSFWQDSSVFSDIFDEEHFIKSLKRDVKVIKKLPKEVESLPRARKHFTSWSAVGYYEEMTHLWKEYKVIHVAKSDSRLANNDLPIDIQRLRCRVLYRGLRFSTAIESLGQRKIEESSTMAVRGIQRRLHYQRSFVLGQIFTYRGVIWSSEAEEEKQN